MTWDSVDSAVMGAKAIAYDGCHKIYVLLDDEQVAEMDDSGYGTDEGTHLIRLGDRDACVEARQTLRQWYDESAKSCGLQFISGVRTFEGDSNRGFITLISQDEDDR